MILQFIMGFSGSGKSTLLYAISGMDNVISGHIYFKYMQLFFDLNRYTFTLSNRIK